MLKQNQVTDMIVYERYMIGGLQTFAVSAMFGLANLSILEMPYKVAVFSRGYGFGASLAGWMGAGEILVMAIIAGWLGRTIAGRDKRALTIIGTVIAGLASLGCIVTADFTMLVICRLAFGMGLGMITAAVTALPVLHPAPERLFAYMQLAAGLVFVPLMFLTPLAIEHFGRSGLFMCELGFIVSLGSLSLLLPQARLKDEKTSSAGAMPKGAVAVLSSLALMYVATSAAGSYGVLAGIHAGMSDPAIGIVMTITAITSVGGAAAAAMLGMRYGYTVPLVVGFVAQVLAAILMYIVVAPAAFVAGTFLLYIFGYFVTPYVQGLLADMDSSGRSASLGGAAISYGFAVGPAIAALFAELPDAELIIGTFAAVFFSAGLVCALKRPAHAAA